MGRNLSKFLSSWEFHILQKKFCEGFSHFRIDLCEKLWVRSNRLNLTGHGQEKIIICAEGCCINGGDDGLEMVECLQFVDDFWMWVWYN